MTRKKVPDVDGIPHHAVFVRELTMQDGAVRFGDAMNVQGYPVWYDGDVLVTQGHSPTDDNFFDSVIWRMRRQSNGFRLESSHRFANRWLDPVQVDAENIYVTHSIDGDFREATGLSRNCEECSRKLTVLRNSPGLEMYDEFPINERSRLIGAGGDRILMCDQGILVYDSSSTDGVSLHSFYPRDAVLPFFDGRDWWLTGPVVHKLEREAPLNRLP